MLYIHHLRYVVFISVLFFVARTNYAETLYDGKPSRYWKAQANSADDVQRKKSIDALKALGDLDELKRLLQDQNGDIGASAARALGDMGAPAVPILASVAKEQKGFDANSIYAAFVRIGAPSVPAIRALIRDENRDACDFGIEAAQRLGPVAKDAVPELLQQLKDVWAYRRKEAALALGSIGPEAKLAVIPLIKLLNDPEPEVQFAASVTLSRIGQPAIPALIVKVKEKKNDARRACSALAIMGESASTAFKTLLSDQDTAIQEICATSLIGGKERDKWAVPLLLPLLTSKEARVRASAVEALGRIGPSAESAMGKINDLTNDSSRDVQSAARAAKELIMRKEKR